MKGYYKVVSKCLRQNGWELIRQNDGSHQMWGKGDSRVTVSKNIYSRHMANAVMKQAGIEKKFCEKRQLLE